MEWVNLYPPDKQPSPEEIDTFIASGHWGALNRFLQDTYQVQPKYSYSVCSGQPGWGM